MFKVGNFYGLCFLIFIVFLNIYDSLLICSQSAYDKLFVLVLRRVFPIVITVKKRAHNKAHVLGDSTALFSGPQNDLASIEGGYISNV